jgi:phosphoglycerate dehydrogenase-like enzyme
MKIAVLDDWQLVARKSADWSFLEERAELSFFHEPFGSEDEAARRLQPFDIIMAMRERTPFPSSLIARLPALKLFNLTGHRAKLIDMAAMQARGIIVTTTGGGDSGTATAELALALMLGAARCLASGDAAIRRGTFQSGTSAGFELAGKTLGIIGLGRIGQRVARYGAALGMEILAWSQNLDADQAVAGGARYAAKAELLVSCDVISLHLVFSERTAHVLDAAAFALMKPGAILVNTARAGLIEPASLLAALHANRIFAALDVFDAEPLPPGDPLLAAPNTLLTPHVGYGTRETFREFYAQSVANVTAFLNGTLATPKL